MSSISGLTGDRAICGELFSSLVLTLYHFVNWVTSGVFLTKEETAVITDMLIQLNVVEYVVKTSSYFDHDSINILTVKCLSNVMNICSELVLRFISV